MLHVVAQVRKSRLGVAKCLGAGGLAIADGDDLVDETVAKLFHGLGPIDCGLRVEVDVVGHGLSRAAIGRDAENGRDGIARNYMSARP